MRERRNATRNGRKGPFHLPTDPRRKVHARLEGGRVRGRQRCQRQLHHRLQHGELRPSRRPHRRLNRHGSQPDSIQRGVPHAPRHRAERRPPPRNHRRVQHPVRAPPHEPRVLHHRGQRPPVPLLGPRVQGHRLPPRVRRHQAFPREGPRLHPQLRHQDHDGLLRALPRLLRPQDAPMGPQEVQPRRQGARLVHAFRGRGHGHRQELRGGHAEGLQDDQPGPPGN
mmetsp:Transcript_2615/g.4743  ORF Transcript_2615/g.4743 Transcript_2615/m.4743 type:complete len:225 (+) Transcript_2615:1312-1986(+)